MAKVRRAIASGENREPMMRMASAASLVRRTSRRATRALKMMSARAGLELMSRRNSAGRDRQHPARAADAGREEGALAGQQVELADEPAGAVGGDDRLAVGVEADDLDLALEDHEEVVGLVAGRYSTSPASHGPLVAEAGQLGQLARVEGGEGGGTVGRRGI